MDFKEAVDYQQLLLLELRTLGLSVWAVHASLVSVRFRPGAGGLNLWTGGATMGFDRRRGWSSNR